MEIQFIFIFGDKYTHNHVKQTHARTAGAPKRGGGCCCCWGGRWAGLDLPPALLLQIELPEVVHGVAFWRVCLCRYIYL